MQKTKIVNFGQKRPKTAENYRSSDPMYRGGRHFLRTWDFKILKYNRYPQVLSGGTVEFEQLPDLAPAPTQTHIASEFFYCQNHGRKLQILNNFDPFYLSNRYR